MKSGINRKSMTKGEGRIAAWIAGTLLVAGSITTGYAQNNVPNMTLDTQQVIMNRQDAVFNMATSQYWDKDYTGTTSKTTVKQGSTGINSPSLYNISGDDKYIKAPEAGKRYEEFQVFDINGLDKNEVAVGLLTNTLDRATRYDEKGDMANKVHVATGTTLGELNTGGASMRNAASKVPVTAIRFRDKYFLIIGQSDYRYVDGKKLGGDKKVVDALMKGKPITETTFFYELQAAGIVNKNMTVTQFTKLTASQKQRMLNNGTMAGNL